MNFMTDDIELQFVDTNVFVYAYDADAGEKYGRAIQLIEELWKSKCGCLSTQILQEFYVNITRKAKQPLSAEETKRVIRHLSAWTVFSPQPGDILAAIDLHERYQISFWDALVIRSAQQSGCKVLWSEDLADGQDYDGVKVVNPFKQK
jgi:predicted nucleic acid-binding protein